MVKILHNVKIKILCKLTGVCSIYIEFCSAQGIDLDDIRQIDCLAYKYFVFKRFSLVGYMDNIWYCVVCTGPLKKLFHYAIFQNFFHIFLNT